MAQVHLSFDNGPDPVGTPHILEVLRRRGLTATFFVLGKQLATEEGRALAEQIVAEGHRLGNHSYTHEVPLGDDPGWEAVERELAQTQRLLDELWDGPRWFRPFGGGGKLGPHLFSEQSVQWLSEHGFTAVLWNSVPGDWLDAEGWVDKALADADAMDEVLVVLHDIAPEAMQQLDRYLDGLEARGHEISGVLPAECLPMIKGLPQGEMARYRRGSPG